MATITWKCPNCGGGLIFNPETQKYKCEYCLSGFTLEELEQEKKIQEQKERERRSQEQSSQDQNGQGQRSQIQNGQEQNAWGGQGSEEREPEQALVYTCPSCGAEIVTDETTAATFCYYCHNPVVLEGRLDGGYRPDYVVPFAIDRKRAEEIFRQWISRKRYAPSDFYSKKQIESMTGVYFPYWLYSCRVEGELDAEGTMLRMWDAGNLRYTERKLYRVSRRGQMPVKNVSRNALKKANSKLSEGVLPFQTEGLKPFHMGYLAGFLAEKRDVEQQELARQVEQEVREFAMSSLRSSADGYSSLNVQRQTADIRDAQWRYGLFPVWTLTYKGPRDGKIYYFALNGQTGKVCGEIPVDRRKLLLLFLSVFLPLLALLLAGGYFL